MATHELHGLFQPRGIAVVGASSNPSKAGNIIITNLIKGNYTGDLFAINPGESSVCGLPTYRCLSDVVGTVELVVLITPASEIYTIMDDLDRRMAQAGDVRYIVCAAADYAETKTEEGIRRQARLLEAKERYGIRIVGPNCIGVIDARSGVNTTFVDAEDNNGRMGAVTGISFISQSGAVAASILGWGAARTVGIRFNKFMSIGNMADVDFVDLLEYLEQDESTRVIGIYMEGYRDGKRLIECMGRIARKKPIIVIKVGRSSKGSVAANSHTGSMAGSDRVYDAAFRQYGIIRVESLQELVDTLLTFDRMPLPKGNCMFVLSQAGGPGIYCSDEISKYEFIETPVVSEDTRRSLNEKMPRMSTICVPEGYADITASANIRQHCEALRAVLLDPAVDSVCFITVVTPFIPAEQLGKELAGTYHAVEPQHQKPVFFCIMAGDRVVPARQALERTGLMTYESPSEAVCSAKNLMLYASKQARNLAGRR